MRSQVELLDAELPGLWDVSTESIHEARIATRRLRELCRVVPEPDDAALIERLRSLGRALGRYRDSDVMRARLDDAERRFAALAPVIGVARAAVIDRQRGGRRRLIRRLERIELTELVSALHQRVRHVQLSNVLRRSWPAAVRRRIATRAAQLMESIEHGRGVYFPDRSHATRIRVKQLRYAVELAVATGLWRPAHMLKDLKRIQSLMGEIHDAQVLHDALDGLVVGQEDAVGSLRMLRQVLAAEIDQLHEAYLERRERLVLIADVCQRRCGSVPRLSPRLLTA